MTELELYWLAGILEGEGWFNKPSKRGFSPRIGFGSTDEDVTKRVCALLGTKYHVYIPKPVTWKPQFQTVKTSGSRELMEKLRPLMGARRQTQIDAAIAAIPTVCDHPCVICGGEIERLPGSKGTAKYCSQRCRQDAMNANTRRWRQRQKEMQVGSTTQGSARGIAPLPRV